jgi:hypothetical protein
MSSRGRFVLICLVVVLSATGSSARDSTGDAARLPSTEPFVTIIHSQKVDLPWANQADVTERQMLAWIILLMKDGRAAR